MFVCLVGFLTSSSTTRLYRGRAPRQERLTILRAATHETELGDHDFCLSRSHYTDTDPTCRERAATAGIEPGTSSPGVARSTLPWHNYMLLLLLLLLLLCLLFSCCCCGVVVVVSEPASSLSDGHVGAIVQEFISTPVAMTECKVSWIIQTLITSAI